MKTNLFIFSVAVVMLAACGDNAKSSSATEKETKSTNTKAPVIPFDSSSIQAIDAADVDAAQTYKGELVGGITWRDKNGDNVVVLAEHQPEESATASLQAFQYVEREKAPAKQLWNMTDGVGECEVDIVCRFVKESLVVTDLDKDNTGEVWFVYYLACKGDVSPSTMKLLMYEGGKKYAIRGETLVDAGGGDLYGGNMNMDASFKAAGKTFTNFAKQHWEKHVKETF